MLRRRHFQPGDPVTNFTADDYNALCRELERWARLTASGQLEIQSGPGGRTLSRIGPAGFWATLSGASSPYSFTETIPQAGDTWVAGYQTGTTNAYEVNAKGGLGGKRVFLRPGGVAGQWVFKWDGAARIPCDAATTYICPTVYDDCVFVQHTIEGAAVTIEDLAEPPNTIGTCTTDADGRCCVEVPASGRYRVLASADCGDADPVEVSVNCNETLEVDITAASHATMTITYTSECIDPAEATFSTVIHINGAEYTIATAGGVGVYCVPRPTTYTVDFLGAPCFQDQSDTFTVTGCTDSASVAVLPALYSLTGTVSGCATGGQAGFLVEVNGDAGTGSDTTASDGSYTISGLKAGCAYTFTVSKSRYATFTQDRTMPCEDEVIDVSMAPATGYVCFCFCDDPVKEPYKVTDSQGVHTFTLSGGVFITPCITKTLTVNCGTLPSGACEGATFSSTVAYLYQLVCATGGWQLTRTVTACTLVVGGVPSGFVPQAANCSGGAGTHNFAVIPNAAGCTVPGFTGTLGTLNETPAARFGDPCGPLSLGFSFSQIFADTATLTDS